MSATIIDIGTRRVRCHSAPHRASEPQLLGPPEPTGWGRVHHRIRRRAALEGFLRIGTPSHEDAVAIVADTLEGCRIELRCQENSREQLARAIRARVIFSGPRAGEPYASEASAKSAQRRLEKRDEDLERLRWVLAELLPWAEKSPVEFVRGELPEWVLERLR